jgi:hypothetical protein
MAAPGTENRIDTDGQTENNLALQLQRRIGHRLRALQVIVHENGLILRGQVPNFYTKQLVQQAAMEMGASILTNDIQVY